MKNIIKVGNLYVNPETTEVVRAGKEIKLSRRCYDLLLYFIHNRGRIIGYRELIQNVFGGKTSRNNVVVHITYLRQALNDYNGGQLIHTVKVKGYYFNDNKSTLLSLVKNETN